MRTVVGWVAVAAVALSAPAGCGGDDGDGDGDDGPVVDGDADADADTDADTEPPDPVITGTIAFYRNVDRVAPVAEQDLPNSCDTVIAFTGPSSYTGSCPGCAYEFDVTGAVDSEAAGPDCNPPVNLTFLENAVVDARLGFTDAYQGQDQTYTNILWFGGTYDFSSYGGDVIGPVWHILRADQFPGDTFAFDGTALDWAFTGGGTYGYGQSPYNFYDEADCPFPVATDLFTVIPGPILGTVTAQGDVDCLGLTTDVYSVTLAAGDTIHVSVDTVAADTAFDPWFTISDDTGCTYYAADENFSCAFRPPTGYKCPSGEFTAPHDGSYAIAVIAYSEAIGDDKSCGGRETGAYDLQVEPVVAFDAVTDDALFTPEIRTVDLVYELSATLEEAP
ncbi:MAG: PPC domain-containing protein [Myxococcota bacterium]